MYYEKVGMNPTQWALDRKAEGYTLEHCQDNYFRHLAHSMLYYLPEFVRFYTKAYEDYEEIRRVYELG